ncbi:MAG: type II secretion system protein GspN [Candidatus Manganitrophus sp. SB1]|nr:type II secretion system protein GspN [Candidatus Manganitrophus morganii]
MFDWIKNQKGKWAVGLGYAFFGLLMLLFFLYLTFPFGLLESRLIAAIESESGCTMAVGKRGIFFPLRLSWREIQVDCQAGPVPQWKIQSLDAAVAPLPLLFNRRGEIDYRVGIAEGEIIGHATAVQTREGLSLSFKSEGQKLNLSRLGLSGLLDLQGEGSGVGPDLLKAKGSLTFTINSVQLKQVGQWMVPIGEVSFSSIRGKINLRNGMLVVERFAAQGNEVDLTSDGGNLILREPLEGSLLSLSLKATPKGSLQQMASLFIQGYSGREPLSLGLKGSIGQPQISVNGRPFAL